MFGYCKSDPNIPIAHLDYSYIRECNDAKELGKLLKILRSKEEGHYPDLVKYTEDKLKSINPQSKLLQKETKVKSVKDLDKKESLTLMDDLLEWSNNMSSVDKEILQGPAKGSLDPEHPPIRTTTFAKETKNNLKDEVDDVDARRKPAPRSYNDWDKLNIEKELTDVDNMVNEKPLNKTRISDTSNPLPANVRVPTDLSESEIAAKVNLEKNKGNEAFKSGDFNEALVYYNRCIALQKSPVLFNNRAITHIKLGRFEDAIIDCNKVLGEEPDNFKAFLRRGIALKSLNRYKQALHDFETVLQLAPTNKRAQTLADEVRTSLKETGQLVDGAKLETTANGEESGQRKKGKRLIIEEVESTGEKEAGRTEVKQKQPVRKGKRLQIIEVDSVESTNEGLNGKDSEEGFEKAEPQSVGTDVLKAAKEENSDCSVESRTKESTLSEGSESKEGACAESAKSVSVDAEGIKFKEAGSSASQGNTDSNGGKDPGPVHKELVPVAVLPVPENVLATKNDANSLYQAGRFAEAMNKYSEAIDTLSIASKGHEKSIAVLLSNRAICKSKIGDCKGCVKDATESINLSPTAKAFLRRASAYEIIENYRFAYVDYQTAVSFDNSLQAGWSGISRLTNMLRSRDGVYWREKLPKTASYANLQKVASSFNGQQVGGTDTPSGKSVPVPDSQRVPAEVPKTEVNADNTEEKFRSIKEKGNQFVQKKMFEDAVKCYSQCIELLPGEVACYTNRALCYLKLNKAQEAEDDASKALSLQEDNIKALFRRASARKMLTRYTEAARDLVKLLECEPTNVAARKELDVIRKLQNESGTQETKQDETRSESKQPGGDLPRKAGVNAEGATSTKEKLIEDSSKDSGPERNAEAGNVRNKKGKRLKIVELDEMSDVNKIGHESEKDDKIPVENQDASFNESRSESLGNISSAGSLLSFEDIAVPSGILEFVSEGRDLFSRGKYAEAVRCYTKAIDSASSDNPKAFLAGLLNNRGVCRLRMGDSKGCINDVTESLKHNGTATSYVNRALALDSLERYRDAYVDYMAALRIDSSVKVAWDASTRLIDVLRNQDGPRWREKLPKQSEPDFGRRENRADRSEERKEPGAPEARITEIKEDQAPSDDSKLNAEKKSDNDQIKSAKKTESKQERSRRARELGNKCVQDGLFQEAAAHYSQCIDLFPQEGASFTNRALCYLKLNKLKKAENDCTKALELQPNNIKALFRRALARKAPGKYKEALQDLTSLLKLDPQNGSAKKELETIKDLWREELKALATKSNDKSGAAASQQKQKKSAKVEEVPTKAAGPQSKEGTTGQKETTQPRAGKEPMQRSPRKLHLRKASGFEFLKAWNELKGRSLKDHAELLSQIEPAQLPKVISNKIDGEMIQTIVSCVHEFFMTKDKLLQGFHILRHTGRAERFNMGIMFLSTKDLSNIRKAIEDFEGKIKDSNLNVSAKEISELKKAYKVS